MKKVLILFVVVFLFQKGFTQSSLSLYKNSQYQKNAKEFLQKILLADKYDTAYKGYIGAWDNNAYASILLKEIYYRVSMDYSIVGRDTTILKFTITVSCPNGRSLSGKHESISYSDGILKYTMSLNTIDPNSERRFATKEAVTRFDEMIAEVNKKVFTF